MTAIQKAQAKPFGVYRDKTKRSGEAETLCPLCAFTGKMLNVLAEVKGRPAGKVCSDCGCKAQEVTI